MFGSILKALAGLATWLGIRERRAEKADDMEIGATAQREADQLEEIRKLEGQLDDAVNHDPDVWRDRARNGRF